jgi:glycosyltransferase involved in cell wall biosynthesis
MKIILLTTGLLRGGAERQVLNLMREYRIKGHNVIVVSLTKTYSFGYEYTSYGVIQLQINNGLPHATTGLLTLTKIIRIFKPDVIHGHMFHANMASRLMGALFRRPKIVNTAHSHIEGSLFRYACYYFTHFLCDYFSSVSRYSARILSERAVFPVNTEVVYNGVRVEDYCVPASARAVTPPLKAVVFSRLSREKNIVLLLQAWGKFPELRSSYLLTIHGDGDQRDALNDYISQFGLQDNVEIRPSIAITKEYMAFYDVVIVPSLYESFSLVALEALLNKRVVACTVNSGVYHDFPDMVFPFDPNCAQSLVSCMRNIYTCVAGLTGNSEDRAKPYLKEEDLLTFDISNVAARWLELYE